MEKKPKSELLQTACHYRDKRWCAAEGALKKRNVTPEGRRCLHLVEALVVAGTGLARLRRHVGNLLKDGLLSLHDGERGVRADGVLVLALAREAASSIARVAVLVLLKRVEVVRRARLGGVPLAIQEKGGTKEKLDQGSSG